MANISKYETRLEGRSGHCTIRRYDGRSRPSVVVTNARAESKKTATGLFDPNTEGAWTEFSFDVAASGLELSFIDCPGWIALDNFFVTDPSAAPLPGALALFVGGLGMMALFGWRRKKQAVAIASQSSIAVS